MDLTTLERVKTATGISSTDEDSRLSALISSTSATFEQRLGRYLEKTARTEVFSLPRNRHVLRLPGYPIDIEDEDGLPLATFDIQAATRPVWDDVASLTRNVDYIVNTKTGVVSVLAKFEHERTLISNRNLFPVYYRVQWKGGFAEDTDSFVTAYPDIASACEQQIAYFWSRRDSLGGNSKDRVSETMFTKDYGLLPHVVEVLNDYKAVRY